MHCKACVIFCGRADQTRFHWGRMSSLETCFIKRKALAWVRLLNSGRLIVIKHSALNCLHSNTYEFRVWKAGDLSWTLEALRRTKAIVEFEGEWTIEAMNKICDINTVNAEPVPAVRRIRRAPIESTLGELFRSHLNGM